MAAKGEWLPLDITDAVWAEPRAGMGGRRIQHRVVLVRHGESAANRTLVATGAAAAGEANTPLTERGHRQALEVVRRFEQLQERHGPLGPVTVEVSPLLRAVDTALPFLAWAKTPPALRYDLREYFTKAAVELEAAPAARPGLGWVVDDPELADERKWTRRPETPAEFKARVCRLVDRWRRTGSVDHRVQTVAFTHSVLIRGVLNGGDPDGRQFHLANGAITVIDFDAEGGLHIHGSNNAAHLSEPTGQHTPFTP